jgi:ribosomal protein S18 acetylase RimI-like enzyme
LTTSVVFGAFTGGEIVGMIGLKPERGAKDHHKGFLWGMYVEPRARRQGAGAALVEALLRSAVDIVEQVTLSVVEGNDAAIALYRKFGFDIYGVEPRSLKSARGYSNEVLMVRFLKPL